MMENELDMEDIESRLYSQVYHSNADEQLTNLVPIPRVVQSNPYTLNNVAKHAPNRYFHKEHVATQPLESNTYIAFDDINSLQNNISISPTSTDITTEGNFSNQFQNNITVNQYTVPVILKRGLNEVLNDTFGGRYFTSWAVQNEHLIGKKRKRSKKERNKEKKQNKKGVLIGVNLNGNIQKQANEVICVSDDSNECIIQDVVPVNPVDQKNISTGFPKKYNDDESSKKPESDDDIIYIPPPPIEVVNVDADEQETESAHNTSNSHTCVKELSPSSPKSTQKESSTLESSTSNDFLDSTAIENNTHKFNFSLHGSDFNNSQGEFVRPANPVDFCETESSCSTNELNRDFHNSVKTVVFDEVEFPREDIFLENNLEKFGSYITPRRNRTKRSDDNTVSEFENTQIDVVEIDSSTDSSSESDYEQCVNRNLKTRGLEASKKLPTLSPMLSDTSVTELTTPKRISRKKKTASPTVLTKKDLSKKKLVVDIYETDSDTGKEAPKSKSKKQVKKKKKKVTASTPLENCPEIDSDSRRKRKKKQALETPEEDDSNLEKSLKKKKGTSGVNNPEGGEHTDEGMSQKRRRRKSVPSELHEIENKILSVVLAQKLAVGLSDPEQPQDKKKSNNAQNEETSQKRKKKHSQELKTPQNDDVEASMPVNQAEETVAHESSERSRGRKKKLSSESNSGNEGNIDTTRKKKRNRSGSKSPEKDNVPSDSEQMVTASECTNQETVIEKPKKKKRKSERENPETDYTKGDNQEKVTKISFSELLEQQPLDIEDRIEAEVRKKKKKTSSPAPDITFLESPRVENTAKSDSQSIEVSLSSPQEKEGKAEENRQQCFDESVTGQKPNEIPVNRVESSALDEAEVNNSDEELIVVDDIDLNFSNLIVVDEAESTVVDVLSSDSEYDFKELNDVGKDLELANCMAPGGVSDDSDELIVVDEDSGSGLDDRFAVDEDYTHFDVEAIQRNQTDDPDAWKVSYKDRYRTFDKRPGPRCNRCRHFGHSAVRCAEKILPPNCSLCGNPGHEEPRCPNKICRQCGNEGDYSTSYCWKCFKFRNTICKLCNMDGHIAKTCPDLWRRYHLTTKEGPLVVPQQPQLKPRDELWCSGCAQRGHMEHECNYFREYPPIKPSIVSYEDVLHEESASSSRQKSDKSGDVCSRSKSTPVHAPHDTSTPCPQNSSQIPVSQNLTQSGNTSPNRCKPKRISSSQSQVPILSDISSALSDKGLSQNISPNEASSQKQSASSVQNDFFLQAIPSSNVVSPSESHNVPSSRSEAVADISQTSAESLKQSTSIQACEPNQSKSSDANTFKLPFSVNQSLNSTECDYDNLLLAANPGLLGHIRSIQFGGSSFHDNIQDRVQPVPAKMIEQTTGHVIRKDQHRIKCLIMHEPVHVVREFLRKEMSELKCWVSKRDPKFLLKQYFKYNKLSLMQGPLTTKTVSDKCFWFRILNMFLFGVHELDKGRDCMRVLYKFLTMQKQNKFNRVNLVQAHKQIFGVDKHGGVNYPALIHQIMDRK